MMLLTQEHLLMIAITPVILHGVMLTDIIGLSAETTTLLNAPVIESVRLKLKVL